jgi:tRNA-(ms[2]io[6]A)-hydroxylase
MMFELVPTTDRWVARAEGALETLLLDHAHCEKKAAATALSFIFRMPDRQDFVAAMSRLAREELLHFERLLPVLGQNGFAFRRLSPSAYAGKLVDFVRRPRSVQKMDVPQIVDELLVAALIEARSTERFLRLAQSSLPRDVRDLFVELAAVEERHKNVYFEQAILFDDADRVARRAIEIAHYESTILESADEPFRLHAG